MEKTAKEKARKGQDKQDHEERTSNQIRTARKIRCPKKKESLDLNSAKSGAAKTK